MHNNSENIIIGSRESLLAKKHIDIFENELIKIFLQKLKFIKNFLKQLQIGF